MTPGDFLDSIDRRKFLKIVSLTGLAGLVYPPRLLGALGPMDLSKVVIIDDSGATSGWSIDQSVVQNMMDCGIMRLTGLYDVGEAWKSLFAGIDTSSIVAIKVNCINSSCSTHPEVANAVATALGQMLFGGTPFPENNIIIYDRTNWELSSAGYTLNTSTTGVRCFGTNQSGVGYSTENYDVNGISQRLSTIITETADYLVNLSVLKNHSTSGVTICLKNHYGTCNGPGSLHGTYCNPYIPALNALAPIRDKQCVNICDALFGIYSGGPSGNPQFVANTLIMSQDIVAVDCLGREILEDHGCTTTGISGHVDTAAEAPYNLGTNDPGQMDVENISDTSGTDWPGPAGLAGVVLRQNQPNPFADRTRIRFHMSEAKHARLCVYDTAGRRVRSLVDTALSAGWHEVPWDGLNDARMQAAAGVYYCRLETDGYKKAIIMQLVR